VNKEQASNTSEKLKTTRPNRIWFKLGIGLIILLFSYIFIVEAIVKKESKNIEFLILVMTFVFSFYWRLYLYYKLTKFRNEHNENDFIEYFDNLSFIRLTLLTVVPFPITKKLSEKIENNIRIQFNIWTGIYWLIFILLFFVV
jgi:hypothetical protein